ncbi:MAG: GntR family transcriptional regulator [Hyphomonadaceae bacterium]|nr:GntR family transcriptional regulator [Hyphomonadaceae bacterium]
MQRPPNRLPPDDLEAPRAPRAFEEICAQIRAKLIAGELKPGDRLPTERELAVHHGVSRTAVREAMRSLEMFGLIALRKGSQGGAFILDNAAGLVSQNFRDMLDFGRISLETFFEARTHIAAAAIRLIPGRATQADLDRLFDELDEIDALTASGEHSTRSKKIIEFSEKLVALSDNKMLYSIICASSQVIWGYANAAQAHPYLPLTAGYRTVLHCLRDGRTDDASRVYVATSHSAGEHSMRIYRERMSGMA